MIHRPLSGPSLITRQAPETSESWSGPASRPASVSRHRWWPLGTKRSVIALTILTLAGIVAFGVSAKQPRRVATPAPALSRPDTAPQRPAFTRAEEAYIQALWPIHGDVERSTVRLSLGKIFYKTNDSRKGGTKAQGRRRNGDLTRRCRGADQRAATAAVAGARAGRLSCRRAAVQTVCPEALKMFEDGNDEPPARRLPARARKAAR